MLQLRYSVLLVVQERLPYPGRGEEATMQQALLTVASSVQCGDDVYHVILSGSLIVL
jgi:hypothetical protein